MATGDKNERLCYAQPCARVHNIEIALCGVSYNGGAATLQYRCEQPCEQVMTQEIRCILSLYTLLASSKRWQLHDSGVVYQDMKVCTTCYKLFGKDTHIRKARHYVSE